MLSVVQRSQSPHGRYMSGTYTPGGNTIIVLCSAVQNFGSSSYLYVPLGWCYPSPYQKRQLSVISLQVRRRTYPAYNHGFLYGSALYSMSKEEYIFRCKRLQILLSRGSKVRIASETRRTRADSKPEMLGSDSGFKLTITCSNV